MRHHRERRDRVDQRRARPAREQVGDRVEAGEDQEQAGDHRQDKGDHLVARHRRGHAGDGEIGAGEEQAAEIACDDLAVVRIAEDVRGDDRREGERQGDRQERPRSEELGEDRLPGRDRHGQQELERAGAALLGPQPHADRRHEDQVQPRVPAEEGREARFSPFKEIAGGEGEKAGEQQEDHQEHIGHRRGEIADKLALGDGEDRLHRLAVSGRVTRRNTSSSCPASLYIPSTFQPSRLTSSTMPCASSAARALSRG